MVFESCQDVEAYIVKTEIESLDANSKLEEIKNIEEFLNRENNGANSKLRRRLTRFIQSLGGGDSGGLAIDGSNQKQIPQLIYALSRAKDRTDVEITMNSFELQSEYNELDDVRDQLKDQLMKVIAKPGFTNQHLRRRMERLAFVVSTKAEQEVIKSTPKVIKPNLSNRNSRSNTRVPTVTMTNNTTKTDSRSPSNNTSNTNANLKSPSSSNIGKTVVKSSSSNNMNRESTQPQSLLQQRVQNNTMNDLLYKLKNTQSSSDLETLLIPMGEQDFKVPAAATQLKTDFLTCLNKISENKTLVNNAKLRRKLKRVLDRMNGNDDDVVDNHGNDRQVGLKNAQVDRLPELRSLKKLKVYE